jgi:hypothetical protein
MCRLKITMDGQIAVLAVAEKGSFEAAGKYLGITKSAARKQVHGTVALLGPIRLTSEHICPTLIQYPLGARRHVSQVGLYPY